MLKLQLHRNWDKDIRMIPILILFRSVLLTIFGIHEVINCPISWEKISELLLAVISKGSSSRFDLCTYYTLESRGGDFHWCCDHMDSSVTILFWLFFFVYYVLLYCCPKDGWVLPWEIERSNEELAIWLYWSVIGYSLLHNVVAQRESWGVLPIQKLESNVV